MTKRQKKIVRDIVTILTITVIAVVGMIHFKDWVNRSEAMRAMEHLGRIVMKYRQDHGAVPGRSFVDTIRSELEGTERLGALVYRAQWINFDSKPDEILAYTRKNQHSPFMEDGYVVLRLSGEVEWINKDEFFDLLAEQQTQDEIQMLKSAPNKQF